jgi:hypothetical protein
VSHLRTAAKAALQAASVAAEEAELRLQRAAAEIAERRKATKGADAEVRRLAKELADAEAAVAHVSVRRPVCVLGRAAVLTRPQTEMAAMARAAQEEMQLSAQHAARRAQAQELRERVDSLAPRLAALEFSYRSVVFFVFVCRVVVLTTAGQRSDAQV